MNPNEDDASDEDDSDSSDGDKPKQKRGGNAGGDDDDWTSVGEDRQTIRTRERNEAKRAHYMQKYGNKIAKAAAKKEA